MNFVFTDIPAGMRTINTLCLLTHDNKCFDTKVDITAEGLKKIKKITIINKYGDEIAVVEYNDGRKEEYDAATVGDARTGEPSLLDDKYTLWEKEDDESKLLMWCFRDDSDEKRWAEDTPTYKTLRP